MNYDALPDLTGDHFIEFPEAWKMVREFNDAARTQLFLRSRPRLIPDASVPARRVELCDQTPPRNRGFPLRNAFLTC